VICNEKTTTTGDQPTVFCETVANLPRELVTCRWYRSWYFSTFLYHIELIFCLYGNEIHDLITIPSVYKGYQSKALKHKLIRLLQYKTFSLRNQNVEDRKYHFILFQIPKSFFFYWTSYKLTISHYFVELVILHSVIVVSSRWLSSSWWLSAQHSRPMWYSISTWTNKTKSRLESLEEQSPDPTRKFIHVSIRLHRILGPDDGHWKTLADSSTLMVKITL